MNEVKASDRTTLLLNNAWQPITVVTARAAFNHLLRRRISAIDCNGAVFHSLESWNKLADFHNDQPCLKSAKDKWPIPTIIIVTSKFFKRPKKSKLTIYELAKLCDYTCQYCLEKFPLKDLTIDHVHPKSKGGDDSHSNRVLSCGKCNRRKGNLTPWYDKNGNIPTPPEIPRIILQASTIREEWEPFIAKA
jgi:5-methylcytosine-specific restriction endonuclease McrA